MKELSDEELQRFLDGLTPINESELDLNSPDLMHYEKIFDTLKNEANLAGAPFGFADKMAREAFLESERKASTQSKIWMLIIGTFAASCAAVTLIIYGELPHIPFLSEYKTHLIEVIAFVTILTALIQFADKQLNIKSKNSTF